jgi:hypothetical protein
MRNAYTIFVGNPDGKRPLWGSYTKVGKEYYKSVIDEYGVEKCDLK